ncbi:MAG: flagellar basal body protein [Pseudomonadota bacterium]
MSISALSAGVSGVNANQQALSVSAHNVANANTENFKAQQANFQESSPAGSGVTLSPQGLNRAASEVVAKSGTDLAAEITNSLVYKNGADLSSKVIKASDERLGTLIDLKA